MLHATGYSMSGLRLAYTGESAFRQETWLAVILLPAAFWVGRTWLEVAMLVTTVFIVLIVELLNSAVEAVVDRVGFEMHALSARAKDIASAAVFLSLALCGIVWALALWQRWLA